MTKAKRTLGTYLEKNTKLISDYENTACYTDL
jgi:hypothetical protein